MPTLAVVLQYYCDTSLTSLNCIYQPMTSPIGEKDAVMPDMHEQVTRHKATGVLIRAIVVIDAAGEYTNPAPVDGMIYAVSSDYSIRSDGLPARSDFYTTTQDAKEMFVRWWYTDV